jgi:outer membrane protein
MKNLSLIINVVLSLAVALLYYLHFSSQAQTPAEPLNDSSKDLKIAYINADSVLKHYDYFKINRDKLEAKGKKLDQDLRNRAQSLQNDYAAYQRNLSNMTIGQAKAVEEDLAKKQQNLRMYQESLGQELMGEEAKITQELYAKVTDYLKKYAKDNGIQFVFKYDPSSDLLYGGEALDISKVVTAGLNDAYTAEQSKPKADTTKVNK